MIISIVVVEYLYIIREYSTLPLFMQVTVGIKLLEANQLGEPGEPVTPNTESGPVIDKVSEGPLTLDNNVQ